MGRMKSCDEKNQKLKARKKRKRISMKRSNVRLKDGLMWKETVEILQKRYDLALKVKDQAVSDAEKLQIEIQGQSERLEVLRRKQQTLKRLESEFEGMMRENVMIRKEIHRHSESLTL